MALNFPSAPTNGDYDSTGKWQFSSTPSPGVWKAVSNQKSVVIPSATPPANPVNGNLWYNTNDGTLYIYYTDQDGSQWVEVKANSGLGATLGARVDALEIKSPNYIINGAFDINQRGGTSAPGGGEAYGPDRWAGSGVTSVAQTVFGPSDPSPLAGVGYFVRLLRSSNVGNFPSIAQRVEDVRTLSGQVVTFSFYARTTSAFNAGTWYSMYYQGTGSGGGSGSSNYTQTAFTPTSAWQRFIFTYTVPSISSVTIGANSFLAVGVRNDAATATSGQLDITGVQLEAGSTATAFRRNANSIQGELAACQRYYFASQTVFYQGFTGYGGDIYRRTNLPFPVSLRRIPTAGDMSFSWNTGAPGADGYSVDNVRIYSQVNNTTSEAYVQGFTVSVEL